jgi:hypothetical protein
MSVSYDLRLMAIPAERDSAAPLPARPADVPDVWENAGLLINHSLLVAEILGIDASDLLWRLEAIWAVPAEVLRAFDEEDARVMDRIFERVEDALGEALDEDGAPRGELGARLAASDHLGSDRHGKLYFRSHRLDVRDLRRYLGPFRRFLRFAADQGLWLRVE